MATSVRNKSLFSILFFCYFFSFTVCDAVEKAELPPGILTNGMVTMVDLGAAKCIPCRMMAPILEKLKEKYEGKAAIIFIDILKDPELAKPFEIRVMPTQIFFDKEGREVFRHEGFLSEEAIVSQLKKMGVS